MNRRTFLGGVARLLAGATLDPERLLWVPGATTYFLPSPPRFTVNTWYQIAAVDVVGRLDHAAFWSRALTPQEVQAIEALGPGFTYRYDAMPEVDAGASRLPEETP